MRGKRNDWSWERAFDRSIELFYEVEWFSVERISSESQRPFTISNQTCKILLLCMLLPLRSFFLSLLVILSLSTSSSLLLHLNRTTFDFIKEHQRTFRIIIRISVNNVHTTLLFQVFFCSRRMAKSVLIYDSLYFTSCLFFLFLSPFFFFSFSLSTLVGLSL